MLTKEILDSHPLKTLKSEIAKQNIKGYSTMKRPQLTDLMMKHKDKFMDLKHAEKKERKKPIKKKEPIKKEVKEEKEEKKLVYKTDSFLPQSAKFFLTKIFKVNIKKDISHEAEKRKRWLKTYMQSKDYEIKEWSQDTAPFLKQNKKDLEKLYKNQTLA
jgi:hypothetical protein